MIQAALLEWFQQYARDLPWRRTRDPYAVLVSEMMLQQTQVERVIPKWTAWLEQFPTLTVLAVASRAEVIRAWQGLGYNLRAVRLHEIARQCVERFGGQLPNSLDALLSLNGIGRYTAGAVACFAFEQPVAMVDTNVRRVLGRVLLGEAETPRGQEKRLQALADAMVPPDAAWPWNQALMDLGATVCTVERPACIICPLLTLCEAAPKMSAWPEQRRQKLRESRASYDTQRRRQSDNQRFLRGRIVDLLRERHAAGWTPLCDLQAELQELGGGDPVHLERTARRLAADGLLALDEAPGGLRVRLPD